MLAPSSAQGQTFSLMGYQDPCLYASGKLDLRLHRQLQAYSKDNPLPTRVKPVPLQIIYHVVHHCAYTPDPRQNTVGQMTLLGFFFLLRPGEYAYTESTEAAPFRICDAPLLCNNIRLDPMTCPEHLLDMASQVTLEFTKQKNGVHGELVGQCCSGHPLPCPVRAMVARMKHLRLHSDLY
jgi:hypothetical protein